MSMGNGALVSMSRKQKLNTRSSTEAELVGIDDAMNLILWTKLFLEAQGYNVASNVLFQDNKSAILISRLELHASVRKNKGRYSFKYMNRKML